MASTMPGMTTVVRFGNDAPMVQVQQVSEAGAIVDVRIPAPHMSASVTTVEMRDGFDDEEQVELALSTDNDRVLLMIARELGDFGLRRYAVGVEEFEQVLAHECGGRKPAWVACDDAEFEGALAEFYRCPAGEPVALQTFAGRDALHDQHMGASQPARFNQIAVSANAVAESTGSTTLPGEITTAGGGLVRATATYAHTLGTNTSTLVRTVTANVSDVLPVVIAKVGVLNAASAGTLGYEKLMTPTATLSGAGDNVVITFTPTIG